VPDLVPPRQQLASTEALAEVWLAMRTTAAVPEG
jgi:hypothetical protein